VSAGDPSYAAPVSAPTVQQVSADGWQGRFLGWLNRRKRLSVLVPVFVLVLGTPHSCPFC
jgi:hypothetical protein